VAYPVAALSGLNLAAHVGHLSVESNASVIAEAGYKYDYTDYLVGVNKDFTIAGSAGYNAGINYSYKFNNFLASKGYNYA
jgi:hypothetical protein